MEVEPGIQRGYNLLHARLSYDFDDDRAQVAFWADNLTDEQYFSSVLSLGSSVGTLSRYFSPPLTFGAEFSRSAG